ncbi:MAG: TrkH family potassium uptake protein, partial [Clostridia bacterium]|nr:TrkH family potassium uptake protein [Clostridia bacterium]
MNHKIVSYMLGRIMITEGLLMCLPLLVGILKKDNVSVMAFLIGILVAIGVGLFLVSVIGKKDEEMMLAKDGFAIVALAWILMSLVGALPFYISGEIPSYVNALFETVSGFTTTGASTLEDIEAMSRPMLFWRSFTHWIGGMGILVFVLAVFPHNTGRSMHVMRAEMPGPIVGKLVPKAKETAKILYLIYIALTLIEIVLLAFGDMTLFESVVHSFGTAGTGGFGVKADSIGGYSAYSQWVIAIFMMLFGINFNLFYLLLIKRFREVFKSTELWWYLAIIVGSALFIGINIYPEMSSISETIRASFFQVTSIMTTTGYSTVDFNLWSSFAKTVLVILMFIGACAGSTGGGIKVSRFIIAIKSIRKDIKKMINPRSVASVKFEGKALDSTTVNGVGVYFSIYFILFFVLLILVSLNGFDFETNFTALAATYNNIGPGLG